MEEYTRKEDDSAIILIVDDVLENLRILGTMLKKQGYHISVATDGAQAFKAMQNHLPDLILLDVVLPDMDGFQICEQIKLNDKTKEIPVIFLSAKNEMPEVLKGFQLGAVDYITKPFNTEELLLRVETHIKLRRQHNLLNIKNKQLQELIATKDKLFSIIGHDLKNPIAGILGIFELMALKIDALSKEEIKEFSKTVLTGLKSLSDQLEGLLLWSKMQIGSYNYNPVKLDLFKQVDTIISVNAITALSKGIIINNLVNEDIQIYADEIMLRSIIHNLLSNAIKFTYNKGRIECSCFTETNYVTLCVKDNGRGMTDEELSKLFKIDKNLRMKGTNGEQGTGLGLLIVREMVEINMGVIDVESASGTGTTFLVKLPKFIL